MPFTPSHAVVALPFVRTPLVPAAVAIGAMTPDLPLFTRGFPLGYGRTHDLAWLPATVLVALVLLIVWRCALRPAVRELAPAWLARRLPAHWDAGARAACTEMFPRSARAILLLLASLVIGVVSHIVWDLFTHDGRFGVDALPALEEQWGLFFGYKWLQYASTVAGLAVIGIWMLLWLRRQDVDSALTRTMPNAARWVWWLSLPAVLTVTAIGGYAVLGPFTAEWMPQHLAYRILLPACAVWAAGSLLFAIVVQMRRSRATSSDARGAVRPSDATAPPEHEGS